MDVAMINYMRKEYNLMIGDSTAEKIKKEIGTAIPSNNNTYAVKVKKRGKSGNGESQEA